MNLKERFKEAYENVAFGADTTWTNTPDIYQKTNMDLYLKENQIQRSKLHRNRPRTVRESIPKSRLAQYANYVYNESREMSYASSASTCDSSLANSHPSEPWEMPEVGELYKWFLKNQLEDTNIRLEARHESPLLHVQGFEDKIMKIQITEDRVKNIWKKDNQIENWIKNKQLLVNVFTSPTKNIYLFNNERTYNQEWFRQISVSRDFEQVEQLAQKLKQETKSNSKFLSGVKEPPIEPVATEILYSEVLQGVSPSRKFLPFKSESKTTNDETSSASQDSFTNYTILNSQRSEESVQETRFKLNPANYFQLDSVPRQARTLLQPLPSTYVQQTYFYSPVQAMQRFIPSSYYPTQVFTSSWFSQNPLVSNRVPMNFDDKIKNESVDIDSENHQVSISASEELEIQAIEQYNSNENFYQELEKQAAEQYASSPE